jgi:DNA mismatch repair protein MutL
VGLEGGHRVHAFLAAPEAAASTARSTFLFVGRRFVRDRSLLHALSLGYGEILEKGRYPLAALFLEVPGADLDVNVHPQKLEVRFARAAEVYAAVRHVVAAAVARAPWLPSPRGTVRVHTLPPAALDGRADGARAEGFSQLPLAGTSRPGGRPRDFRAGFAGAGFARSTASFAYAADGDPALRPAGEVPGADGVATSEPFASSAYFQTLTYIGQLDRTYLVCEANAELVLVDQHAAHERVAFDRLRVAHRRHEIRSQRLLFPIPVELDDEPSAAASGEPGVMEELGFTVERTGPTTVLVSAVPEVLKDADVKPLLVDVLGRLADDESAAALEGGAAARLDRILASMACHSVVRAGDVLSRPQVVALLAELDGVDLRTHCPHGRPVLLRWPLSEIERRFGRS